MIVARTILLLAILSLLSACSSDTPVSYYLLEPEIEAPVELNNSISIEILDLEIPQYMERFQIASRRSDNRVVFSSTHQWGESLRKNITRVMARNLIHELETPAVGTPGSRLSEPADFKLKIYIESFERGADEYVHLVARWQLLDSGGMTIQSTSHEDSSPQRIIASDFAGTVGAMSEMLGEFSQSIAGAVRDSQ